MIVVKSANKIIINKQFKKKNNLSHIINIKFCKLQFISRNSMRVRVVDLN